MVNMIFYDGFISYGRVDSKVFATKLYESLKAQGLNIWFDQEDIPLAVDFQAQINDDIPNDKSIKLWNLETGQEVRTLTGHNSRVYSVNFSPDGQILVSGSMDKTVKIWNLPKLEFEALMVKNCDWVKGYLENNPLKNNPDVNEDDRTLCDGW